MTRKLSLAFGLLLFSTEAFAESFTALLSCGFNGSHINIAACFTDTDLKLTNNGQAGIYKIYNIGQLGTEYRDGLHIELSQSFKITAQNSNDTLVLGLVIKDGNGNTVYQDAVGRFGVIKVGN
tara:strand:+ start:1366 stop:1734 length:369 start_codon:yes stop_codon:yes gene_type:complete